MTLQKKKKKVSIYFLILSYLLANACIWVIDLITPGPLPNLFVWFWIILYTFILYKKFINEMGSINNQEGEINMTLRGK